MTKIIPSEIRSNSFDKGTFSKIKALLETIPSDYYQTKATHAIKDLITFSTDLPKESMLWVIGQDPVYFLQTKKESSAIFRIENVSIIVYSPKFIQYPQIAHIPVFKDVPENHPFKLTKVEVGSSVSTHCETRISEYILAYYSNTYESATDAYTFQQQFLTNMKHKLSKESGTLYWHLVLDTKLTQISFFEEMPQRMIYKIEGPKVDKYLYMFSQKGLNNPVAKIIKTKWKQILTFILLFVMLMTVATCPDDGSQKPAYCASKGTVFYIIGGFFMIMVGMKISDRKKKKVSGGKGSSVEKSGNNTKVESQNAPLKVE